MSNHIPNIPKQSYPQWHTYLSTKDWFWLLFWFYEMPDNLIRLLDLQYAK